MNTSTPSVTDSGWRRPSRRYAELHAFLAVAAATLAFGAVYPWAYWPVLLLAVVAGGAGLRARSRANDPLLRRLALPMGMVVAAIVIQLIPMPRALLKLVGGATDNFLQGYDLSYATAVRAGLAPWHATSIDPLASVVGLAFVVVLFVLTLGLVGSLTSQGVARTAQRLLFFGFVLAIIGIVQYSFHTAKPYGFWQPVYGTDPFGPFVNRDHFAGWMLMGLGSSLGFFVFLLQTAPPGPTAGRRMSNEAIEHRARLVVTAFAIAVMLLSLVLTISRAGLGAFVVTAGLFGAIALFSFRASWPVKLAVTVSVLLAFAGTIAWVGVAKISDRYVSASWDGLGHRTGVWRDTLNIIHDFPVAGTGFNTFGTATIFYNTVTAKVGTHFVQAHNDILQLMAEGGLLVFLPSAFLAGTFALAAFRRFRSDTHAPSRAIRAGALFGLIAVSLQDLLHFSLLIPANALFAFVLVAIALHQPTLEKPRGPA